MPIPPPPITYACPSCGWSQTVIPRSDALTPWEYFDACPKCGHAPLEMKPANVVDATLGRWTDSLKRLWR